MKVSIAVVALLGLTAAKHHHRKPRQNTNVQFIDGDFEDTAYLDSPESFIFEKREAPVALPIGQRMSLIQQRSDPIHGSLGPIQDKVKPEDKNEEVKLEEHLSSLHPREFHDDQEQVIDTDNSLKIAEKLVGHKLEYVDLKKNPPPTEPKPVEYEVHDSDDED
jgi:hypothetical protein